MAALFTDDGQSAKNFDRADWKQLELFISKHHRDVDTLIVCKYDRFSRNAAQGLNKIELFEKKYRIVIVSVFEQMFIDYDSPYFFKQRADMLVNAEFELHVIRDRTKFGIHNALLNGRYINMAPFGYTNGRDERNKTVLNINESKATIIKNIFAGFLRGASMTELKRNANHAGLTSKGNSIIQRILSNPTYAGLIFVPPYRKEPEKYVKGIHDGIVSETTWWRVQEMLGNTRGNRTTINEEVPLRNVLLCGKKIKTGEQCGHELTAGNSKGRTKYYWYYKCPQHVETSLSAVKLHKQFDDMLANLSLSDTHINFLEEEAEKMMKVKLADRVNERKQLQKEYEAIKQSLLNLEEKFIQNSIAAETYKRWYSKYSAIDSSLRHRMAELDDNSSRTWALFKDSLPRLQNVPLLYKAADITQKRTFVKLVFNSTLHYVDGAYRTNFLLPIFTHNALILKEKALLFLDNSIPKSAEKVKGTRDGS